ncbi:hypothetical protein [Nevskia ramosa]|uniref:hypothetical protein n=1 Tax=Nevskia ramosa TaxID=64002 RepID=UPI003D12540A
MNATTPTDDLPAYLSILDAQLLMRQFQKRNCHAQAMNLEQRRAWAAEMVAVMEALVAELQGRVPRPYNTSFDHVPWNAQMRAGTRPVTYKIDPVRWKSQTP